MRTRAALLRQLRVDLPRSVVVVRGQPTEDAREVLVGVRAAHAQAALATPVDSLLRAGCSRTSGGAGADARRRRGERAGARGEVDGVDAAAHDGAAARRRAAARARITVAATRAWPAGAQDVAGAVAACKRALGFLLLQRTTTPPTRTHRHAVSLSLSPVSRAGGGGHRPNGRLQQRVVASRGDQRASSGESATPAARSRRRHGWRALGTGGATAAASVVTGKARALGGVQIAYPSILVRLVLHRVRLHPPLRSKHCGTGRALAAPLVAVPEGNRTVVHRLFVNAP